MCGVPKSYHYPVVVVQKDSLMVRPLVMVALLVLPLLYVVALVAHLQPRHLDDVVQKSPCGAAPVALSSVAMLSRLLLTLLAMPVDCTLSATHRLSASIDWCT